MTTKQVQSLLTYLGYNPGDVDGVTGAKTIAAVETFQSTEGLRVDGIAGASTEEKLLDAVAKGRFYTAPTASTSTTTKSQTTGTFWDGIKYFTREEWRCQCGGKYCNGFPAEPSETLVKVAEAMREQIGKPMVLTSGLRCTKHNAEVGGVSNSRHLSGKAMDFYVSGMTAKKLLDLANSQPEIRYAYAINDTCIHMDVT